MQNKIIQLTPCHYSFCTPLFFSVFAHLFRWVFLAFIFHLLFSLSLTLIVGILYCLNYIFLLFYLIITHLVQHLSLSSIVFIISTLIIGLFYCLKYTSLLFTRCLKNVVTFIQTILSFALSRKAKNLQYIKTNRHRLILEKLHGLVEFNQKA